MKANWWVLVLVALCAVAPRLFAQARSTDLCVLDPESKLLPPEKLKTLGEGLREFTSRYPDISVLKGPALTNRLLRLRARCTNEKPACLAAMGRVARAARILFSRIVGAGGGFTVQMLLVDVGRGQVVVNFVSETPVSEENLGTELNRAWETLHGPVVRGQIKISSNVTGAEVFLDGQPIGRTPLVLTKDLEPGQHRLSARAEGYQEREEQFTVSGAEGATLHLVLERKEPLASPVPPVGEKLAGGKEEGSTAPVTTVRRPSLAGESRDAGTPTAGTPVAVTKIEKAPLPAGEEEPAEKFRPPALYERWWFWTAVGVLVCGAGAIGLWYGLASGEDIPAGRGRVTLDF